MVEHDTEEVISKQRVNEHKNILDMIDMLSKRVSKLEDAVPVTLLATLENLETRLNKIENDDKGTAKNAVGDKALLSKLNMDVAENRADLYYVEDELRNHRKDAHISQGQVKKWIHELFFGEVEKIEEAKNDKCQG